jgi:glycosyltransferase involved in cell wall biosynthesis
MVTADTKEKSAPSPTLKSVLIWGTFDEGKPRVRILERGLRENGIEVIRCHTDIWRNVEDKSQITGILKKLYFLLKWIGAYPSLIYRFLIAPKTDVIMVSYMGHIDVIILWPFAKLKGIPIVWDAFLSLYNTIVEDRKIVTSRNPLAWVLWALEWIACRAADLIVLDTKAHGRYFANQYRVKKDKISAVFVGAEPESFPVATTKLEKPKTPTVLFYGQLIPLHGIRTILEAAALTVDQPIHWMIIGTGQESNLVRDFLEKHPLENINWIPWVDYSELSTFIQQSSICLGIFGDSIKAEMVIPNKVFQILSCAKTLITRDSEAIRELVDDKNKYVILIDKNNPQALSQAVMELIYKINGDSQDPNIHFREMLTPLFIGKTLISHISNVAK